MGRHRMVKPDGVEVNFICLEEQLSVVGQKDVTIYRGRASPVDQPPEGKQLDLRNQI